MKSYPELLDEFRKIAEELESLIQKFPQGKQEEVIFDKWSLKNVVSHLNHWMVHDLDCLNALLDSKVPYWEPNVEEFNRTGVELRASNSWNQVYLEFVDLKQRLLDLYSNYPEYLRNNKIWLDKSETPTRFLEEDIQHWRDEHIASLNNFYIR
jgi:hypothetical protein